MPHACVKCKQVHPDQSETILKGCSCGSRIFYFIKTDLPIVRVNVQQEITEELVNIEKQGQQSIVFETDGPENIKVVEPGAYELNIPSLFKGDPVILRTDSDVYYVKLPKPNKEKK